MLTRIPEPVPSGTSGEQDIYFGTLPPDDRKGTFIINGTERVIVNPAAAFPGIILSMTAARPTLPARCFIPAASSPWRGSWLDFDFDHKDILYVRIDRRRKMPATILFKAMGMTRNRFSTTSILAKITFSRKTAG